MLKKRLMVITSIISPIFSLLGFTIFNIPIYIYNIIILFCIAFAFYCLLKIYWVHRNIKEKNIELKETKNIPINILKESEEFKIIQKIKILNIELEKLSTKYKEIKGDLIFIIIILIILWIPRREPIKTLTTETMDNIISSFDESENNTNQSSIDELEDEHKNPSLNELEENNKIPLSNKPEEQNDQFSSDKLENNKQSLLDDQKDENIQPSLDEQEKSWTEFSLAYPNGYPKINDEEYIMLKKSLFYEGENNLRERIESEITIWLNSCQTNNSLDTAVTSSGKSTEYFSNIETSFTNENGRLLSSDLLDEVISGRKELYEYHPNGLLAWFLANNMHTYALNYLYLTNDNKKSVLYFYLESIKYTQESLEFDIDIESKYKRIKYLQSRYKDIADCEIINENIQHKASKVYMAIQEVLDELHIS